MFTRAQKEVDAVLGMKQEISYDDLGELTYLGQVHPIINLKAHYTPFLTTR